MYAIRREENYLDLRDIPKPQLKSTTDVLIKVQIAGLCRTDLYVAQGKLKAKTPITLGHEFSGVIEEKGVAVKNLKCGDRVACFPLMRDDLGNNLFMGIDYDGAFAEYVRVQASQVYLIPDTLSFQQGAYLEPIAASLAPLNQLLDKTAVGGIWGNNRIALLTLRIFECMGYYNVSVIDPNNSDSFNNQFDYLIETELNNESVESMVRLLKPGAKLILKSRPFSNIAIPVRQIVQKEIQLLGSYYGDFEKGIQLLADKSLYVDDLFGDKFHLSKAMELLREGALPKESKKVFFIIN